MAAITGAVIAAGGLALQAKGMSDAKKAANKAANTPAPQVDIAALQTQAQQIAAQNAAASSALERQYNPGAQELRSGSLQALLSSMPRSAETDALAARIYAQAGDTPEASALFQQAVAKAQSDLALGGRLSLDTQNTATRRALAQAGSVGGNLGLGRDLVARDLGLTSAAIEQQRLQNAANIGAQDYSLGLQRQAAGTNNLFNSANFFSALDSGEFAQKMAMANLGQNIAAPMSGLDPGSLTNLAIGNTNAQAQQQQQGFALKSAAANQLTQLGGQMFGATAGLASGKMCWVAREVYGAENPSWTEFRQWMLNDGSPELVEFYGTHGPEIAEAIKNQPNVKILIRHLMDAAKGGK